MTTTRFDPAEFKQTQRTNWNAISSGWARCEEAFETGGAPVTARLLELGGVRAGQRVLDVGTGIGEPAISAANLVGQAGHVTGIDLAPAMIAHARQRAASARNVEFAVCDVESMDFPAASFDVVLSRWGLMFAVDHVRAFRALANVLVPGGVLAAAVWAAPGTAPMMSLGFQVLSKRLDLPPAPPGAPSPFSMAEPDAVAGELSAAGFEDVEVTSFDAPFVLGSAEDYVAFNKVVTPPGLKNMLGERFGSVHDPETWAEVGRAVEPHRAKDGTISLPSKALLLRATTPSG